MKNIKEEIGRNFHSLNTDPVPYDYDDNIPVTTIATQDGKWQVKIDVKSNPEYSVKSHTFEDEMMAKHFARQNVEAIKRKLQNESVVRSFVRNYLILIL